MNVIIENNKRTYSGTNQFKQHLFLDKTVSSSRVDSFVTKVVSEDNTLKNEIGKSNKCDNYSIVKSEIKSYVTSKLKKNIIKEIYSRDDDDIFIYVEIYDDSKSIEENLNYVDTLNNGAMNENLEFIFVLA